jgi:hypothetical protein
MESVIFALWARIVTRISLWNFFYKISRPVINWYTHSSAAPKKSGPLNEWLKARDLPRLPNKTFRDRWKDLNSEGVKIEAKKVRR